MASITISNFDDRIRERLEIQAAIHGRTIEEEAREILQTLLTDTTKQPSNLASLIKKRFAAYNFELPEIPREPINEPPNFEQ